MRVAALIPAFNEEDLILETIKGVRNIPEVDEIVVINDGSQDGTGAMAQTAQVRVIDIYPNRGKGGALNAGWRETRADIYLLLDADLGETAAYGSQLLAPVLNGEAHMTIAEFSPNQAGLESKKMGFGIVRRFAAFGLWFYTRQIFTSPLSGQRAVRACVLDSLGGFMEGFGVEVGLTVGAVQKGYMILEIPVSMEHRGHGRGVKGFLHRGRQLIHICKALWKCREGGNSR